MPTDEERREVARRLREIDIDSIGHGYELLEEVANRIGCEGVKYGTSYGQFVFLLADLVEPSCDRERLMAIAAVMAKDSIAAAKQDVSVMPPYILHRARDIAESCGETLASLRSHDVQELGVSIIPEEAIVDRDALLDLSDEMEGEKRDISCATCRADFGLACYDYKPNATCMEACLRYYARRIRKALGVQDA